MSGRLEGRVAVITGATSGIGEATAELFIEEGAKVVIAGRGEENGNAIAERLGENAAFCKTDVMREDQIEALIKFAVDRFGNLDCLFNNAGGSSKGTLEDVTPEDFDYSSAHRLASDCSRYRQLAREESVWCELCEGESTAGGAPSGGLGPRGAVGSPGRQTKAWPLARTSRAVPGPSTPPQAAA